MQRRRNESRTMLSTLHFCIEAQLKGGERLDRSMDFLSEVELLDLNILTTNLFQEQIGNFRETSKLLNFVRPKLRKLYQ